MTKLAMDPPTSERQRRAMWSAAEGSSTLGIPKSVGKEFVGADAAIRRAAGIAFTLPTGEALFIKRSDHGDHAGEWCFPGGGAEGDESPEQTARREAAEETGMAPKQDVDLIGNTIDEDGVHFLTFRQNVVERFDPMLNDESTEFAWAPLDAPPNPLHPGVAAVLQNMAMDAKIHRALLPLHLALDRESVRTKDRDGRLHVAITNLCKVGVNPYRGDEIPNWQDLGLEPEKIYKLFRSPEALEKATPTINGIPLMRKHIPVSAEDHQPWDVVGAIGTTAKFDGTYIKNGLTIWAGDDIDGVESEEKFELSPAYHYVPVMNPGAFNGEKFDGLMTAIEFNHEAIVERGRQGTDVVIGDQAMTRSSWEVLEEAILSLRP